MEAKYLAYQWHHSITDNSCSCRSEPTLLFVITLIHFTGHWSHHHCVQTQRLFAAAEFSSSGCTVLGWHSAECSASLGMQLFPAFIMHSFERIYNMERQYSCCGRWYIEYVVCRAKDPHKIVACKNEVRYWNLTSELNDTITQLWGLSLAKQRDLCITVERHAICIALFLHGTYVWSKMHLHHNFSVPTSSYSHLLGLWIS